MAEAIESILAQEYWPYEIILVDGQSTDRTAEIAKNYQQIRYIFQPGHGIADAYNLGIAAAKGEFISFLSADDRWTHNKLSLQMNFMIYNSDIQYSVGKVKHFLEEGSPLPASFNREFLEREIRGIGVETLIARKELFDRIGTFNSDYVIAEDIDWYARAIDHQIPMAEIPNVLLYKRVHESSITIREAKRFNQIRLQIIRESLQRKQKLGMS